MLLLCTTLFGTLAARHTCHPPRHTLSHCSLSHFFLERTHAWWDHTPGPGASVYYVWVGLSSRCLVSRLGKPQNHGEAQHLSVADRGVAQLGEAGRSTARQRPGSGLVHVFCGLPDWCAGSHNLAPLQTSLPWRSAVPSAKQSREGINVLNTTPVPPTEQGVCPLQHTYGHLCATQHLTFSFSFILSYIFLLVLRPVFYKFFTRVSFLVCRPDEFWETKDVAAA